MTSMFTKAVSPICQANRRSPLLDRFWSKITLEPGLSCWVWTGHRTKAGYGMWGFGGHVRYVHRWSYEHFVGPIPTGMHIDHLCNRPWCVNPNHLEPVTQAENNRRAALRRKGLWIS